MPHQSTNSMHNRHNRRHQLADKQGWIGKSQSRCPICCILPPYLVDEVVKNGTPEQRTWALETLRASEQFRGRREVVGAITFMASAGVKRRTVYDAKNSQTLPGALVRGEGDPPCKDVAVNEAYDAAGATYDLYHDVFERNMGRQLDGQQDRSLSRLFPQRKAVDTVHYRCRCLPCTQRSFLCLA